MVVTGKDYETVCTSFTVRRGNNPPLTVTLVPAETPAPVPLEPEKLLAKIDPKSQDPPEMPQPPGGEEVVPVAPSPPPAPILPTLQEMLAGDPGPRIGPLVEQCREAVQEQDWKLARKCSVLLLAAARRGAQERTMAQVTLLCQGLSRDPPDATAEQYLQGLETPGAFAADCRPTEDRPAQSCGP